MFRRNECHIVLNAKGGWDVKRPGAERARSLLATQAETEMRAKEMLAQAGGGETVIHGRDGQIRDPNPPLTAKH
jgi:hypothetical protein